MAQLELFSDQKKEQYLAQDFIETAEIRDVLDIVEKFLADNDFDNKQITNLIIKGEKSSGKTHLINYLKDRFDLKIVNLDDFDLKNDFMEGHFYVFDDVDEINDDEKILNIINLAKEAKSFLIFTLEDDINTKIRDLRSRLNNFFIICEILGPCQETIKQLLIAISGRKQIKLKNKDIAKILAKKNLSYDIINNSIFRDY